MYIPDRQPIASGTVAKGKDLRREIMLPHLLPAKLMQIPLAHRVVQAARPQFRAVGRNVDARSAVCMTLESSKNKVSFKKRARGKRGIGISGNGSIYHQIAGSQKVA